ncbi:MAG: hypothetical protein HFJ34_06265 [Clostridia bacterium]|nr:hypothetical protein [Clostridia bacterium]
MKIEENVEWVYYIGDTSKFIKSKVGKWMYFFKSSADMEYIKKLCSDAVMKEVVKEAKYTSPNSPNLIIKGTGVCCFYLNCDDMEGHKKILSYFIQNNMISKTKAGKFWDISFKLDNQTRAMEYGEDFHSNIKLSNFIDLYTGEWLI